MTPPSQTFYSLIESAKLNRLNPQHYLADLLTRIADHPARRIAELLPWKWEPLDATRAAAEPARSPSAYARKAARRPALRGAALLAAAGSRRADHHTARIGVWTAVISAVSGRAAASLSSICPDRESRVRNGIRRWREMDFELLVPRHESSAISDALGSITLAMKSPAEPMVRGLSGRWHNADLNSGSHPRATPPAAKGSLLTPRLREPDFEPVGPFRVYWGVSGFSRLTDRCAARLDMHILDGHQANVSGHDRTRD